MTFFDGSGKYDGKGLFDYIGGDIHAYEEIEKEKKRLQDRNVYVQEEQNVDVENAKKEPTAMINDLSEADMEYLVAKYPEHFIEKGLTLIGRQICFGQNRLDILFQDRKDAKLIVELQKGTLDRKHLYRMLDYYDDFKRHNPNDEIELLIIANEITLERKEKLYKRDIEFKEIPMSAFISVAKQMNEYKNLPSSSNKDSTSTDIETKDNDDQLLFASIDPIDKKEYFKLGITCLEKEKLEISLFNCDKSQDELTKRSLKVIELHELSIKAFNKAIELDHDYYEAYAHRGNAYYNSYDMDDSRLLALKDYDRAIAINSNYAEGYLFRGKAHANKLDYALAVQDYNKALELNPHYAEAFFNRGLVYHIRSDYENAIKDFTASINIEPSFAMSYYERGISCLDHGDYDLAIEDFTKAIELKLRERSLYYFRGKAYGEKENYVQAIIDYTSFIALAPACNESAYYERGKAFINIGDYDRALSDFDKLIQDDPDFASPHGLRGDIYLNKGRLDLAIQDYKKALELSPDDSEASRWRSIIIESNPNYAEVYLFKGKSYANGADYDLAVRYYNMALELNPHYTEALWCRGQAYHDIGDYENAYKDFAASINIEPNLAMSYFERGMFYSDDGLYDLAIEDFTKAVELGIQEYNLFLFRGNAYTKKGYYKQAILDYSRYIDMAPHNASLGYANRGKAFINIGDYKSAINDSNILLQNNENDASGYGLRGDVCLKKDRIDLAIKYYRKALEFGPNNLDAAHWKSIINAGMDPK
jgi:tetratricopeptide (TPR) repeat protein